jgi:RNA:NAD 2'-phosphotransferase (TPT1/KptA family)
VLLSKGGEMNENSHSTLKQVPRCEVSCERTILRSKQVGKIRCQLPVMVNCNTRESRSGVQFVKGKTGTKWQIEVCWMVEVLVKMKVK